MAVAELVAEGAAEPTEAAVLAHAAALMREVVATRRTYVAGLADAGAGGMVGSETEAAFVSNGLCGQWEVASRVRRSAGSIAFLRLVRRPFAGVAGGVGSGSGARALPDEMVWPPEWVEESKKDTACVREWFAEEEPWAARRAEFWVSQGPRELSVAEWAAQSSLPPLVVEPHNGHFCVALFSVGGDGDGGDAPDLRVRVLESLPVDSPQDTPETYAPVVVAFAKELAAAIAEIADS